MAMQQEPTMRDRQALEHWTVWRNFARLMKLSVAGVVIVLAGMAFFLL